MNPTNLRWRSMVGEPGGSTGVDHAFAEQNVLHLGLTLAIGCEWRYLSYFLIILY
jgi:hypothetical protein